MWTAPDFSASSQVRYRAAPLNGPWLRFVVDMIPHPHDLPMNFGQYESQRKMRGFVSVEPGMFLSFTTSRGMADAEHS
jgi:hypothetical protein